MKKIFAVVFVAGLLLSCSLEVPTEITQEFSTLPEVVDFNYHVKPILSDRCYQCHGPDEKTRKAGLRLDIEDIAFSKLKSGKTAFSNSSIYSSEVAHRILSQDKEEVMPPPESKLILNNKEKAIIQLIGKIQDYYFVR